MKIATDIEVIGLDIQTSGGTAFFRREFVDKLCTHPKIVEAYSETRNEDLGNGWTIYIAEDDGTVTVLGYDAKVDLEIELRMEAVTEHSLMKKPATPRDRLRALKAHPKSVRGRR